MIDYPQFSFAAPPGVYSHWFVYVCGKSGLLPERHFHTHIVPPPENHGKFVLSIVRHPLTWLYAYYTGLQGRETRIPEVDVFRECYRGAQKFPMFVDAYLKKHPGAITRMFIAYRASNVMRVEDFPYAVVDFLQSMDIEAEDTCRRFAFGDSCGWMHDRDMRRAVVMAERGFCLDYDYW